MLFRSGDLPVVAVVRIVGRDHCRVGDAGVDQCEWHTKSPWPVIIRIVTVVDTVGQAIAISIYIVGEKDLVVGVDILRMEGRGIKEWRMSQHIIRYSIKCLLW